jgi:hypothetical protein
MCLVLTEKTAVIVVVTDIHADTKPHRESEREGEGEREKEKQRQREER